MENKLEIIIRYTYKEKEYYIVLKDKKIYFVCSDNSKIKFELDDGEKYLALKVYSTFLANKEDAIKVDKIKIHDRKYDIFYDKKSRNYFWYNLKNISDDNTEDNIYLNMMLNHQDPIVYVTQNKKTNLKQRVFTKLILFGTTTIVAFCSAIINPATLASDYKVSDEYSNELLNGIQSSNQEVISETQKVAHNTVDEVESHVYDWDRIKKAIEQNNNLSNEEKDFLYNLKFVFDAHHDYMDLKLIEQRLRTFTIDYKDEIYITKSGNFIGGGWSSADNSITLWPTAKLYNSGEKHNFKTTDKGSLIHEILHMFQEEEKNCSKLYEPSTEYEARNIFEVLIDKKIIDYNQNNVDDERIRYGNGYDSVLPVYYILTKFMTNEEILKFQYTGDMEYIAQALTRYGTEEEAYELLTKIKTTDFYDLGDEENGENKRAVYKKLNDYYIKANGKNIYDDLEMAAIIDSASLEWNFYYDEIMLKSIESFEETIKNEFIKNGIITSEDNVGIVINLFDFNYNNDLFFGNYREGITIYPELIIRNGENKEYKFLAVQLTEEMQQEFEKIYQRKIKDMEIDR